MTDVSIRRLSAAARLVVVALGVSGPLAVAQGAVPPGASPAPPVVVPDAPEPRVDTSVRGGASATRSTGSPVVPANVAAAPAGPSSAVDPATPAKPSGPVARRGGRAMDRVDLESSQITGNRELPRVLYIVPWRAPASGEIEGRPVNSLLYELTKPVDREVFRRENRYFDALQARTTATAGDDPATAAPTVAPDGPEK